MPEQLPETVWRNGTYVYLRPIMETDIPLFQRWINDEKNARFLSVSQPMGMVAEQKWYEQVASGDPDYFTVAICLNDEHGTLIGNTGIQINVRNHSAVTGTLIGPHEYKGKGYATDAKMLMLDHAFNWRGLRKVTSQILAINGRSQQYAARCGYREMARIEEEHFRDGQWIDELLFVVFANEWRPLWKLYCDAPGEFFARRD